MARHQRGGRLDLTNGNLMKNTKTEKALSGLEWAIAQTIPKPKEEDEFTVKEFGERAGITYDVAEKLLRRMQRAGQLTCRKVGLGGSLTNLYRKD